MKSLSDRDRRVWNAAIRAAAKALVRYADARHDEIMPPHVVADWRETLDGKTFANGAWSTIHDAERVVSELRLRPAGRPPSRPETIAEAEFTCPRCSSHEWGTANATARRAADMIGHCHGIGCRFTWPRSQDRRYFKPTGRVSPRIAVAQMGRIPRKDPTHA